jgi:hypothetical protein
MRFQWLDWSNPVAVWWICLLAVSIANIALWLALHRHLRKRALDGRSGMLRVELMVITIRVELMVLLCAAYVFGCAFRSVLPRADVQRICLFDTWLSSVLVGRSVATIAELCFVAQWAIVLHYLGSLTKSDTTRNIAYLIVPLILIAECCSWYSVITTDYLGNTVENSIWLVTFLLIAAALLRVMADFRGAVRFAIGAAIAGIVGYLAFLAIIDVPMYFERWQADMTSGKQLLGVLAGLHDVSTRWAVTHDFAEWRDEIAWMSLYFSTAVWSSLALCSFGLVKDRLPRYLAISERASMAGRQMPVRA